MAPLGHLCMDYAGKNVNVFWVLQVVFGSFIYLSRNNDLLVSRVI